MTEDDARDLLRSMVAADVDPTLSAAEVQQLLDLCRSVDRYGLTPDQDSWTPTFDLELGAAEGWRWKAGKAASRYPATVDGATLNRDAVWRHCQAMVTHYADRSLGNIHVPLDRNDDDGTSVNA